MEVIIFGDMKKLYLLTVLLTMSCVKEPIEYHGPRDLTGHTAIVLKSDLPINAVSVKFHEQGEFHSVRTTLVNDGHIEMKPGWYTISNLTDGIRHYNTIEIDNKILSLDKKVAIIRVKDKEITTIRILD